MIRSKQHGICLYHAALCCRQLLEDLQTYAEQVGALVPAEPVVVPYETQRMSNLPNGTPFYGTDVYIAPQDFKAKVRLPLGICVLTCQQPAGL